MNLYYWGKTSIKLSNLINSVYNFNRNGNEAEKVASKLLSKQEGMLSGDDVVTQAV